MPGMIALFGTFMIMIILLAVLALIVVKALAEVPWGTVHRRRDDPDRDVHGRLHALSSGPGAIGEVSVIGFVLLMLRDLRRAARSPKPDLGAALHLHRHSSWPGC